MTEQQYIVIKDTLDNYETLCKRYLPNAGITERLQIKAARQILDAERTKPQPKQENLFA